MKTLCPICSDILLRHLDRSKISWFCLRCHQEMPNFNLIKFSSIHQKIRVSDKRLDHHKNSGLKNAVQNICQAIQYKSNTIDLLVDQNKIRLEVIDFILNKIDLLLANICLEHQQSKIETESLTSKLKYQNLKINTFIKAQFLRDSELILLRICQAILVADQSILKKKTWQELKIPSVNLEFQIEKTYFVDLIKTLVMDFIKSIALDSSQNFDGFASEISSYFEIVISLMITPGLKTDATQN